MKFSISVLLFTASFISCMDKQIKPYEPGFFSKNPLIGRSLKSAGAGVVTYAATQWALSQANSSLPSKKIIALAIVAATGMWLYDENKKPYLLDAMICNPLSAHTYLCGLQRKLGHEFESDLPQNENPLDRLARLLDVYERQEPQFLLGECDIRMPFKKGLITYRKIHGCLFDRSMHPNRRAAFENKIAEAFKGIAHVAHSRPIIYASVGAGGMFQDAVILTQFLAKNPQAHIDIHLIDLKYGPLADYMKKTGQSEISSATVGKEQINTVAHELDCVNPLNVAQAILGEYTKHKQLLFWLKKHFPHARVHLFAHDTVEQYCASLESAPDDQYPDIMCAADVQDDYRSAVPDFLILCQKTLLVKPESKNVGLIKSSEEKPVLWSVLAKPDDSNKKIELDADHSFDHVNHTVFLEEQTLA